MSVKNQKISPQIPSFDSGANKLEGPQSGQAAQKTGVVAKRFDPAEIQLPPRAKGFSARPSVLQDVIEAGLAKLAAEENWNATDNALGVLVRAMARTSSSQELPKSAETLPSDFQRLLRSMASDPALLPKIKKDAQRLVELAVVALGTDGFQGLKKGAQEEQISADVGVIRDALTDVLQRPAEQRTQLLTTIGEALGWAAGVVGRGGDALKAANVTSAARVDALRSMLEIVASYAKTSAAE